MILRKVIRVTPAGIFSVLSREHQYDIVTPRNQSKDPSITESGWDRVKNMYSRNEYGEMTVELHSVIQSWLVGSFFGGCLGGLLNSRDTYLSFIENNQATIFTSTVDAQKKLQNAVTMSFVKGCVHWGWRIGAFTGMMTMATTTISVYNDKTSVADFTVGGAVAGAVYKFNLGLRAALVGAGVGATVATIGGATILGLLALIGLNIEDVRKTMYSFKAAREQQMRGAEDQACSIRHDSLTRHHDDVLKERSEESTIDQSS